ncbi:MAG: ribosome recycling factor [Candidatus Babeliales bacterium]
MIKFTVTEGNSKDFEAAMQKEMDKPIKHFEHELVSIRTNRAHPDMLKEVMVAAYEGTPMPINQLAAISTPDARTLLIQPWDKGTINHIEKAITTSPLGLTPVNDGDIIRVTLPEMSSQRRGDLSKILGKKQEDCKVSIRNIRKDFQNLIRDSKKDKVISEDFANRLMDSLEKVTGKFTKTADDLAAKKEKEITTI